MARLCKEYKNVPVTITYEGRLIRFKSKLEYRWANYLEFLKIAGDIKEWFYEHHVFVFENIGLTRWTVDFAIRNNDDTFEYNECKGHFEKRDADKLKLLNKERPEVKLTYVFWQKPRISVKKWEYLQRYCKRVITNAKTICGKVPTLLQKD